MAQLKSTTIQGSARVTDTLYSNAIQAKIFNIPTASNGTTYGPGTDGQVLKSNGTSVYWASDSNSDVNVKQLAAITTSGAYPIILANSTATTEVTGTVNKSANLTYNPSTKALSTGGTINGLTFTAASTGFTIAGGTTSKTLTVSNTYTLGAACAKGVTDNSSNADVTSSDTNLITGRTLYYQLAKKGYTTNTGTVTSVQVQASSPLQSSTSTAQSATLSTTISFTNQDPNKVLAGPSSGSSAGAPSFRALVAADIPDLAWSKITSGKPTTLSGYGITDAAASDHTQAVNKGGTNITSYTIGDMLYASASTTLSKLAGNTTTTVKYLKSVATTSGTAVAPVWAQIAASEISGLGTMATANTGDYATSGHTQAVNKGGTNITSYTIGDILYASAATTLSKLSGNTTTTVKFLKSVATTSGTAVAPAWAQITASDISGLGTMATANTGDYATSGHTQAVNKGGTNITSYTIGDILYASAATTLSKLTGNTTTTVKYLKSVATTSGTAVAPAWAQIAASEISGLGAAATKAVTDNSSNADVTSTDTNLITGRTLYYQLAKKGYTTNTGTVTSVTLTQGAGITVSDSGTAITGSGSRTISITGMNTSSGSTSKCLTEKGTWASFTNNAGTVTSVQVQASGPLSSSTSTAQSSTLSTTISFSNQDPNKVLAGPSSGSSAGAPSFRALVAADIPGLPWSKITSGTPTTLSGYGITDAASSSALSNYVAKSGDTMSGNLGTPKITLIAPTVDFTSAPSSAVNDDVIFVTDKDGDSAGIIRLNQTTENLAGLQFGARRIIGNNTIFNCLTFNVASDGTRSISVSDAAAWRTALGISDTSNYLPLSGGTMTGTITLNNGVAMNTASEAGWSMNQYGNLTHNRTNSNDYLGIVGSNGDAIRFYYDTGEAKASTMTCTTSKPQCIEISGMSSSAGHGGYIDFHFNNSSADYTSRIIESASGVLYANGVKLDNNCVTVPGGNVYIDRSDSPYIHLRNSSAQEIGGLWASVSAKRVYIRVRPSAGSGNATDIIFPAAASSNANYYVYTSANFSLSGTTLTITPPS